MLDRGHHMFENVPWTNLAHEIPVELAIFTIQTKLDPTSSYLTMCMKGNPSEFTTLHLHRYLHFKLSTMSIEHS